MHWAPAFAAVTAEWVTLQQVTGGGAVCDDAVRDRSTPDRPYLLLNAFVTSREVMSTIWIMRS